VGVVLLALAGCSTSGKASSAKDYRPVGGDTVPEVDARADPGSDDPCLAISSRDIRSVFGGVVGTGVRDTTNASQCMTVIVVDSVPTRFVFRWPGSGAKVNTKTPLPVQALQAQQARAAGSQVVSGVGDFAYLDPATRTLYVAKAPNLSFAVQIIPADGTTPDEGIVQNRLKVLANEIIATHTR
jgi:hypothetical protein